MNTKNEIGTKIVGMGICLPEKILTNFDMEKIVETSDEWIRTRTGIQERRIIEKGQATSDLASEAAKEALKNAGLKPSEIDLIVVGTITPDMLFPSTACVVQRKIGAENAACFDISAACSGFPYALSVADGLIRAGQYRKALVIGAEALSPFLDWKERSTCVLFGDGAGACVLVSTSQKEKGIIATYLGSDGTYTDILKIPAGGSALPPTHQTIDDRLHTLKMEGSEVFKIAVRTMCDAIFEIAKRAGAKHTDIDCLIPHQANLRILQAVAERVDIPIEKVFLNLQRYGNMSAASTAVAMYEAWEAKRLPPGSNTVLVAFGGGLTWASIWIRW